MNRQYRVNGIQGIETRIELLYPVDGGFEARMTSTNDAGVRESLEFVSDELLESCVRTGYLSPVEAPAQLHTVSA
jgi:hypothetical protein